MSILGLISTWRVVERWDEDERVGYTETVDRQKQFFIVDSEEDFEKIYADMQSQIDDTFDGKVERLFGFESDDEIIQLITVLSELLNERLKA